MADHDPASSTATPSPQPAPQRLRVFRLRDHLRGLRASLRTAIISIGGRPVLRWGGHVPQLCTRVRRMIESDQALLGFLRLTPQQLEDREEEIQDLVEAKAEIEGLLAEINAALTGRRTALSDDLTTATESMEAAIRSPLTPPEVALRLAEVYQPVATFLEEVRKDRGSAISSALQKKAESEATVAQLEDQLADQAAEVARLRGDAPPARSTSTFAAPAPARRARRPRNTRR